MSTWATVEDVDNITGIEVTAGQLLQAQGVVEIFADATTDASDAGRISPKNLGKLKKATAYQAAWISEHPDAFTNLDLKDATQDGMSFTLLHANSGVLAPMAKRCIDRLSWKRTKSLRIRKRLNIRLRDVRASDLVEADNQPPWEPM